MFSSSSHEKEDEYGGSIKMASNFGTVCVEVTRDERDERGMCIGGLATVATDAFFKAKSRCCFGYLTQKSGS